MFTVLNKNCWMRPENIKFAPFKVLLNYAFCTPDERRFVDELHLGHLLAAELEPRKTFRQEENRHSTLLLRGPRREPVNNHTSVACSSISRVFIQYTIDNWI